MSYRSLESNIILFKNAGPLALSRRASDPVTLRNVSGLSGLGLCGDTGTFSKASDLVTLKNISGLSGPGLCWATRTFLKAQ